MKVTVGASEDYQIVVDITPFDLESEEKILFTDTSEYEITICVNNKYKLKVTLMEFGIGLYIVFNDVDPKNYFMN